MKILIGWWRQVFVIWRRYIHFFNSPFSPPVAFALLHYGSMSSQVSQLHWFSLSSLYLFITMSRIIIFVLLNSSSDVMIYSFILVVLNIIQFLLNRFLLFHPILYNGREYVPHQRFHRSAFIRNSTLLNLYRYYLQQPCPERSCVR